MTKFEQTVCTITNTLKYLKTCSSDLPNRSKYLGYLKINLLCVRNPCMQRNGFVCLKFAALGDLSILTRFLLLTKAFKMASIERFNFFKSIFLFNAYTKKSTHFSVHHKRLLQSKKPLANTVCLPDLSVQVILNESYAVFHHISQNMTADNLSNCTPFYKKFT